MTMMSVCSGSFRRSGLEGCVAPFESVAPAASVSCVISAASAVALTHIYGDNFTFVDSTEVDYGLPARTFKSFTEAAEEAAISRLYGGIHYRSAVEEGADQGKKVGNYIISKIETRRNAIAITKADQ